MPKVPLKVGEWTPGEKQQLEPLQGAIVCRSKNSDRAMSKVAMRVGEWTPDEKQQFERGCILYGWGNWFSIQKVIPSRSRIQTKSRAQKIEKHHPELKARLVREHAAKHPAKKVKMEAAAISTKCSPSKKKKSGTPAKRRKGAAGKSAYDGRPVKTGHTIPIERHSMHTTSYKVGKALPNEKVKVEKVNDVTPDYGATKGLANAKGILDLSSIGLLLPVTNTDIQEVAVGEKTTGEECGVEGGLNFGWNDNIDISAWNVKGGAVKQEREAGSKGQGKDPNLIFDVDGLSPDRKIYEEIRDSLAASANFNKQSEYVVSNDGMTRTALPPPVLMRVRIKAILEKHEILAWWKGDVSTSPDKTIFCAERLIALVAAMAQLSEWRLVSAASANEQLKVSEFDQQDGILQIGRELSYLWERVDRSLSRDAYCKLGVDGMERSSAINKLIGAMLSSSASPAVMAPRVMSDVTDPSSPTSPIPSSYSSEDGGDWTAGTRGGVVVVRGEGGSRDVENSREHVQHRITPV